MRGFLGTGATFAADLNLTLQIAMGTALLVGMALARRKRFRAHMVCQTTVMLLNLVLIAMVMAPSLHRQVGAQIPAGLKDIRSATAAAHAALGTLAELLGLYIVLVAATRLVPARLRFQRYKSWMWTELALWWVVVLFGLGTYAFWYGPLAGRAVPRAARSSASGVAVTLTNFEFAPKEVTIAVGTTIEWVDNIGRHAVEADDGSFRSATLVAGGRFKHVFNHPGVFSYHCAFHGKSGGQDMAGVIKVVK